MGEQTVVIDLDSDEHRSGEHRFCDGDDNDDNPDDEDDD
jgi:hypothetical protein